MPLLVTCAGCGKKLRIPDASAGKKVRCPLCGVVFVAASAAPQRPSPAPPPPPKPAPAPLAREETAVTARPGTPQKEEEPVLLEEEPVLLEEPAPPVRRARRRGGLAPFEFKVTVKKDPGKKLKGWLNAKVSDEGLRLTQGKKVDVLVPPGTPAEYKGGNRLTVEVEGREVELIVMKFASYQKRLARDVVAFLAGDLRGLHPRDYSMEWYLVVPTVLPAGIPIMTLGGAIPAVIGAGLVGANVAIAQVEDWPPVARAVVCWALALAGYLATLILILTVLKKR